MAGRWLGIPNAVGAGAMVTFLWMAPAAWAQGGPAQKREARAATVEERMKRVETGIEPLKIATDAPVELDLAALMKLYNDPALSVAVIEDFKIAWSKAYG